MQRNTLFKFNSLVLLFLLGLNLYIYLNRNEGYAYKEQLSYQQLYELKEDLKITGFVSRSNDSLLVQLSPELPDAEWLIKNDKNPPYKCSGSPVIKLREGKWVYTLENTLHKNQPVKLGLNYTPSENYLQQKRKRESVTELFYSSIPQGGYPTYALSEWQQASPYSTPDEIKRVQDLISKNTAFSKEDSSLVKLKKITAFLLQKLDTCRGIPGDTMNYISPLQRYNVALQGKSKVWCGDFSSILAFFLETKGIVCREVCLEGKISNVYLAGHSLNEVYIPELHKWVLVDLTSKGILVSYKNNYLNTLDLYQLHKNRVDGIKALTLRNDSLVTEAYERIKPFYDYYFSGAPQFAYYFNKHYQQNLYGFNSRMRRYFFKNPTFVGYGGGQESSNEKFYVKQLAAVLLLFFVFYLVVRYCWVRISKNKTIS